METLLSQEASREPTCDTARWLVEQAIGLIEASDDVRALECLTEAHELASQDAQIRSWYGLALARVEHRFEDAVELCESAAKQEFFNPDLYLNLARVYLYFGFKPEGIRYLRRGRMIDPANEAIAKEFEQLGRRSTPPLRFLPRNHRVNRWLGSARAIFTS